MKKKNISYSFEPATATPQGNFRHVFGLALYHCANAITMKIIVKITKCTTVPIYNNRQCPITVTFSNVTIMFAERPVSKRTLYW